MNGYEIKEMLTGCYSDTSVSFDYWLKNHALLNTHPTSAIVQEMQTGKTFKTFCKVWTRWNEREQCHDIARIGLGAYGDTVVYKA